MSDPQQGARPSFPDTMREFYTPIVCDFYQFPAAVSPTAPSSARGLTCDPDTGKLCPEGYECFNVSLSQHKI